MSWRDQLKGGSSFRGKPFHIISAELTGGRRVVKHAYPQRDKTFSEDLGRQGRGLPVEAFLVGEDFLEQLDDLLEALETKGPGELVHAYFGTKNVCCPSYSVRVSKDEGGYATVSITFDETDEEPAYPTTKVDAVGALEQSADAAFVAIEADLLDLHDLTGLSLAAIDDVAGVLRSAGDQLRSLLGPIIDTAQGLAALQSQLAELEDSALALARAPAEMFALTSELFLSLVPGDPLAGVTALLAAYGFSPETPRPEGTTAKKLRAQTTYDATQRTLQRMAVVQAARAAVAGSSAAAARSGGVSSYASHEDAVATRDLVLEALDEQLELASDTAYPALMQLRADLVAAVPGDDTELAHLLSYTPVTTLPALVLSHELYGNLAGEADLIARNRIKHPGFIVGGRTLEVLSRG